MAFVMWVQIFSKNTLVVEVYKIRSFDTRVKFVNIINFARALDSTTLAELVVGASAGVSVVMIALGVLVVARLPCVAGL